MSLNYGEMLLSAVIDRNDVGALKRFGLGADDFFTKIEREAFKFISDYAGMNRGQAPDYRTVINEVPDFVYRPNVDDTLEFMVKKVKEKRVELACREFLEKEVPVLFDDLNGEEFLEALGVRIEEIKRGNLYNTRVGVDVLKDNEIYLAEYNSRKEGKSRKKWNSKFPTINREVGGYMGGNIYVWVARSGRGKSIFTMEEAIESAFQGATVLVWALEINAYEWMSRAYATISARKALYTEQVNGTKLTTGFPARDLMFGKLAQNKELAFEEFLQELNTYIKGNIILRAVDHEDFYKRGCAQLEADILQTKADVVVIDPIYYMDMEQNVGKTAGGDVARTSVKLRHIAGYTGAVLHVITQAEEVRDDKDAEGNRQLRLPVRAEIKKSKAILEDSANTFFIDSLDGRALMGVGKGRNGGEDVQFELVYLPNFGIVKEVDPMEMSAHFQEPEHIF